LNIKLSDKDATNQLDLNGLVEFNTQNFANLSLLPSDVVINRETWKVQEQVKFGFDQGKMTIDSFQLSRGDQALTINGTVSKNPNDHLMVGFDRFKLTTFSPLTEPFGISLRGQLNGDIRVAAIGKAPHFDGNFKVDTLSYNNIPIGDLTLRAGFDNSTKLVDVDVNILKEGRETMDIQGTYDANLNQQVLDLDVSMEDNELIIFEPVLKKLVSNITGKVSADLKVTGKVTNPQIDGTLSLTDAGVTVNYLKTHYRITDDFRVNNSIIHLNDAILRDVKNNRAIANGTVNMSNPNIPDIDVVIEARNFQALNTTPKDNPLYYGVAYGSGTFRFSGPTNDMRIVIEAKTEQGTVFNIPLNAAETISESEFITFVTKDTTLAPQKTASFKGLTMAFDLTVDEKSAVNIITDLGRLSGRGDADLRLTISSFGDFEMFGEYLINQGSFNFTAQEVINKIFEIRQGGSIKWTGEPTEATINLDAVYERRTSVGPLYLAAGRPLLDQTVLAEAIINLKGPILRPDISFDLNFPNDAYIKDELQSYLSDISNLNKQTLSLIARRSFVSESGSLDIGEQTTSALLSAGTELAFNKLNIILAQSLGLKYVDLNIRSLNEASASFRLLNGRLIITGGVTNDPRQNAQELDVLGGRVARDVEALYLLRPDGSLTLKASNRLNNRSLLINPNPTENVYVSAFGLVYRQEFDNFNEFLRLLIGKKRTEERTTPRRSTGTAVPDSTAADKRP
ncbi:MAG TPA: translocation/assembly module TamB domain-containing protein, partial [Sphingobacteriaceae bacterium]